MRVKATWNVRSKVWSLVALEGRAKGKVIAHASRLLLRNGEMAMACGSQWRGELEGAELTAIRHDRAQFISWTNGDSRYVTYARQHGDVTAIRGEMVFLNRLRKSYAFDPCDMPE